MPDVAVIIPAYGENYLTDQVIQDIGVGTRWDTFVVDNQGDFRTLSDEDVCVLRPSRNLGWAGGCNFGIAITLPMGYESFMLLNNDVRLSPSFVEHMMEAYDSMMS